MTLRLHWHPFSIMPWRVRIALHEKGLAYEEVPFDVLSPERSPDFLRMNPFGQIPVLEDGELAIAESMAILEYLEEHSPEPPLLPASPAARATARQLMGWSTGYWPPSWKKWVGPRVPGGSGTAESAEEGRRELAAHLDVLAPRLETQDWLVGSYSLADICYAPLVLALQQFGLEDEIRRRPALARWVERLGKRPAVQAAMAAMARA